MNKNLVLIFMVMLTGLFLIFTTQLSRGAAEYAGKNVCTECHDESYMKNNHSIEADRRRPGAKLGCESCHGPGAKHAEDEDISEIISLKPGSPLSAEKKSAVCLNCHDKGKQSLWPGSEHESRGLSCVDCHSIHTEKDEISSGIAENELCTSCHKEIRTQLIRQSHHPLREGKIACKDCHNPHGSLADKLIDAQYVNLKCFECHAEKRGPFLWEHPSVTENCQTCHTAHGSTHNALLKGRMPYLCQRCHSDQVHSGNLYAKGAGQANQSVYRALNNRFFYRSCLNCHITIHGSNHPSGKSLLR